eukprot:Nk52_evm16s245 gene=Nk52_evmTU16s245
MGKASHVRGGGEGSKKKGLYPQKNSFITKPPKIGASAEGAKRAASLLAAKSSKGNRYDTFQSEKGDREKSAQQRPGVGLFKVPPSSNQQKRDLFGKHTLGRITTSEKENRIKSRIANQKPISNIRKSMSDSTSSTVNKDDDAPEISLGLLGNSPQTNETATPRSKRVADIGPTRPNKNSAKKEDKVVWLMSPPSLAKNESLSKTGDQKQSPTAEISSIMSLLDRGGSPLGANSSVKRSSGVENKPEEFWKTENEKTKTPIQFMNRRTSRQEGVSSVPIPPKRLKRNPVPSQLAESSRASSQPYLKSGGALAAQTPRSKSDGSKLKNTSNEDPLSCLAKFADFVTAKPSPDKCCSVKAVDNEVIEPKSLGENLNAPLVSNELNKPLATEDERGAALPGKVGDDVETAKSTEALKAADIVSDTQAKVISNEQAIADCLEGIDLADFFDNDDDLMDDIENDRKTEQKPKGLSYRRLIVLEVSECFGERPLGDEDGQMVRFHQISLRTLDEMAQKEVRVLVREQWMGVAFNAGDYINVIFSEVCNECPPEVVVDNNQNLIIVHPDELIAPTKLTNSMSCMRRAVLGDRVYDFGDTQKYLLYGRLLHDLFEFALSTQQCETSKLEAKIEKLIVTNLEGIFRAEETFEKAKSVMFEYIPMIQKWKELYLCQTPREGTEVNMDDLNGPTNHRISISEVVDIEENIWSPRFGMRGIVDVSAEVTIHDVSKHLTQNTFAKRVVPFELKTGKMYTDRGSAAHRAQVIMYCLMLGDRAGGDISSGLLFYLKTCKMLAVPAMREEIRGILIMRNNLAGALQARNRLPPVCKIPRVCEKCEHLSKCVTYHSGVEGGDFDSFMVKSELNSSDKINENDYVEKSGNMTKDQKAYLKQWLDLLGIEGSDNGKFRREIWSMSSTAREKQGRCFGLMQLDFDGAPIESTSDGIVYSFSRVAGHPNTKRLLDSSIAQGDLIVLGTENGHCCLGTGIVANVSQENVHVKFKVEIRKNKTLLNDGILQSCVSDEYRNIRKSNNNTLLYRIDKDDSGTRNDLARANIISIASDPKFRRLRSLVIDLAPPTFHTVPVVPESELRSMEAELNINQAHAINKALCAKDYCLVLGMPGTGKTTMISRLVQMLVKSNKSVLISCYTHTAVDNLLLKLKERSIGFLRLGSTHSIHPDIVQHSLEALQESVKTVEALENLYNSELVVATTCLGIKATLLAKREFDFCIIDEASQVTQPICLGPLRFAKTFILVGDHYQLPPLVRSADAQKKGMQESLFKRLCEAHPKATVSLEYQYRMNENIMALSNKLIYNQRLKCGTEEIAEGRLTLPLTYPILSYISKTFNEFKDMWLYHVLYGHHGALMLNTRGVPAFESRVGDFVQNRIEASLTVQICLALMLSGISPNDIGVITPYRSQVKLVRDLYFASSNAIASLPSSKDSLEVHTIDKYQGRDKLCIVISMVRSNDSGHVGELVKDWRRINVALTRAKRKLIIIGDCETLERTHLLNLMIGHMRESNCTYHLGVNAHTPLESKLGIANYDGTK